MLREPLEEHRYENYLGACVRRVAFDRVRVESQRSSAGAGPVRSERIATATSGLCTTSARTAAFSGVAAATKCDHAADSEWWRGSFSRRRRETIFVDLGWRRGGHRTPGRH